MKCPNCGGELEDATCACYDEYAWYCTPHNPNKLCCNGCLICSNDECEYIVYDPDEVVRLREKAKEWIETVDWDAEAEKEFGGQREKVR